MIRQTTGGWRLIAAGTLTALMTSMTAAQASPTEPARESGSRHGGPAERRASDMATLDRIYCHRESGRGNEMRYIKVGKVKREWVPIGEIHTGPNVLGRFLVGSKVSTTLAGGFSVNAGKTWSAGASFGYTQSYTIDVSMAQLKPRSDKVVQAQYKYQKYRIQCGRRDPRSQQVVWWSSPRYRYLPQGWSGNVRYFPAGPQVLPSCKTGRGSAPAHKLMVPRGQRKTIGWSQEYVSSAHLSGIGVSATMSSSTGTSQAVQFWTKRGRTWICGNRSTLKDSSAFYTNSN